MVEVSGGAKEETFEIEPIAPTEGGGDGMIEVITTAPGTFGPGGIAPVGTKAVIHESAFSDSWMKRVRTVTEAEQRTELEAEARALEIRFHPSISDDNLAERIRLVKEGQ
jgi:hypothetical protein